MSKSKSRFLSLSFLSRILAVSSLLGGGGYAWFNSQLGKSNVGEEAEVEESAGESGDDLSTVHAARLIPEFADAQPGEQSAPALNQLLGAADTAKKNVTGAAFSDLNSGKSFNSQPAKPAIGTAPPTTNSFVPKTDSGPPKPKTSLSFTDVAKDTAEKMLENKAPQISTFAPKTGQDESSTPAASGNAFLPKGTPESTGLPAVPKSSNSLVDTIGILKKAAESATDSAAAASESPARTSLSDKADSENGFTPRVESPSKPPGFSPIPNTTAVGDRPPRDPNQKSALNPVTELPKPLTSGIATKSAPAAIPQDMDPSTNSQFSSAGSVASGVSPPANNPSLAKSGLPQPATNPAGNSGGGIPAGALPNNTTLGNTLNTNPSSTGVPARSIGFNPAGTNPQTLPSTNSNSGGFTTNPQANTSLGNTSLAPNSVSQTNLGTGARASLGTPNTNVSSIPSGNLASAAASTPGSRELEGVQTPTLSMEKTAPREIQVGRPATFQLIVKNNGRVPAYGVTVVDEVPQGTELKSAKPNPTSREGNRLIWELGTMQPGDITEIAMELLPLQRGEIGSVARVAFQSQASVRTICTKPQLEIQHSAPAKALIGDDVVLKINVRNSGDGAATGVMIEELIPDNMMHAESNGRKLQYPVGTLAPGEARDISLRLKGQTPGLAKNVISTTGDGDLFAQDELNVEIVAPEIQLEAEGPQRRFLERQAIYNFSVSNLGTASATNVQLVAKLPRGMQFVETDKNGQYDPRSHAVYWSLLELPAGSKGDVKLTLLPIDVGSQKIEYQAQADLNISKVTEIPVTVEQYSELFFDVADVADPIEVGSETVYEIRVVNQGNKPATNVRIQVRMPEGMTPASAEGPTQHQMTADSIVFMPVERLAPNAEARFRVQAKGEREGEHRIQVLLSSDERRELVSKEESTKVYADR